MLCKTFRGWSYITDYFIVKLTEDEAFHLIQITSQSAHKRKLQMAIADDFMRLYAEDQFRNWKWN
jgi:hypothetical protein